MLFTIIIGFAALFLGLQWLTRKKIDLSHIPGPSGSPWWQIFYPPDVTKTHLELQNLAKKYGPIMKISQPGMDVLVLSGYDEIYQATVKEGKTFGGRAKLFRTDAMFARTGILFNTKADQTWKSLRKVSQKHLRQFGDGLSRLETIIVDISEDMFSVFKQHHGKAFNPNDIIFETALNSIAFLILGRRTYVGDPVIEKIREYNELTLTITPPTIPLKYRLLDIMPWLRYFGWPGWDMICRVLMLEDDIWKVATDYAQQNPDAESLCKVFLEHIASGNKDLTVTDAIKGTIIVLIAGVATTSGSFYALINILAHNLDIQEGIQLEIQKHQDETGQQNVTLQDRPKMPFTSAVLLESLRYTSLAALSAPHESTEDVMMNGYKIPAGTLILISIWALHHDEEFWKDPYNFRPERFLDDKGELVPADHPNRKHVMAFGAGTRVCLGESLAMARLFLWLTNLIQRFKVIPAEENEKVISDSRNYFYHTNIHSKPYKVIFEERANI